MARIAELEVADRAAVWDSLGFTVSGACCRVGEVEHRFSNSGGGRGVVSWAVSGLKPVDEVDGLPTRVVSDDAGLAGGPPQHANGVVTIDHLVVMTPDIGRTVDALESAGLEL